MELLLAPCRTVSSPAKKRGVNPPRFGCSEPANQIDSSGVPAEKIVELNIPDRYTRGDPELLLRERIGSAIPKDF
jgi:hypothetical protein